MATPKRPRDINQLAHLLGQIATGQKPKDPEPDETRKPEEIILAKERASKGGKARAAKLSPKKRKASAKKAAKARWNKA